MSKTVVITGAGAGLGRTLARLIAERGDRVILLGRTLAKVEEAAAELGGVARALACDVSSMRSVEDAFARIGHLDVLINNAATYEPFMVADARDDQLRTAIQTNYLGPILTCRAAIPLMGGCGQIINISSESVGMSFPMLSLYQSSKAGMERFSEALGKELSEKGIRVTVVRAGQMHDENSTAPAHWNPEAARRFHELCPEAGLDLRRRPRTHFTSAAKVIAQLLDLPGDMNVPLMQLEGFRG
jgi:NAD(P)-dependent dehydrogenase (short-subunit alcohol dehydrogenase family)